MPDIVHFIIIHTPPEKVYNAITQEEGVRSWWTTRATLKPTQDSIARFDFGDKYHNEMKITKLLPDKEVAWQVLKGDKEWVGTLILFYLREREDGTTGLRFTHAGWKQASDFYGSCNLNWGYYLASLKGFCETGEGMPFSGA
jgi:uncharacterized protein YndB with AHSA1/START domain